jgi:predicted metalloprotease
MKWKGLRKSNNVKDKRKVSRKVKYGGAAVLIGALFASAPFLSEDVKNYIRDDDIKVTEFEFNEHKEFIQTVLALSEDVWKKQLGSRKWKDAKLILYQGKIKSPCGLGSNEIGPFYCPADQTVYIDLDFFGQISGSLKVKGDAAEAYVVYHEIGHHVQYLTGELYKQYRNMNKAPDEKRKNQFSVELELQADCYAGVVFHHTQYTLEEGDIAEVVNAAARIGDDWLQKRAKGYAVPDSFNHGTSNQRATSLLKGYQTGSKKVCDQL